VSNAYSADVSLPGIFESFRPSQGTTDEGAF